MTAGREKVKVLPRPGSLLTQILPSMSRKNFRHRPYMPPAAPHAGPESCRMIDTQRPSLKGTEMYPPSLLLVFTLLVSAVTPAFAQDAAGKLPRDVHWVRNSAEYRAAVLSTYAQATRRLEELVQGREAGTWAVALDADETVISNSLYQKELADAGVSHSRKRWNVWVARREASPLPGARGFLERVHALGGKIAIVTNRAQSNCAHTEENFRSERLPFDVILCRKVSGEKEPRWERVEQGTTHAGLPPLVILLWLGDNIRDFPGWRQKNRFDPEDAYVDFGRKYFLFPNPMYGSWTDNKPE